MARRNTKASIKKLCNHFTTSILLKSKMESWSSRGSSIFSLTSTVVGLTALAIALSSYFLAARPGDIDDNFGVKELYRLAQLKNSVNERAIVAFEFDVDFNPLLHWNVKQVFAYVVVEYETEEHKQIHQIVFNKILRRLHEEHHKFLLKEESVVASFPIDDIGQHLKGKTLKFTLHWEIVPYVGLIYRQEGENPVFYTLPEEYVEDKIVPTRDPVGKDWTHEYNGYGSMYNYYGN